VVNHRDSFTNVTFMSVPFAKFNYSDQAKGDKMGSVCGTNENMNVYRLLVGKPEEMRPLGRRKSRYVDNIRMDLGEIGWGDVDWIGLD
jgi:hypothetical protein